VKEQRRREEDHGWIGKIRSFEVKCAVINDYVVLLRFTEMQF
jgi:hypothetical protein